MSWFRVFAAMFVGALPLTDLDTFLTMTYHDARASELASTGLVLIIGRNHANIYRHGALHETIRMDFDRYHTLKSISHIPLTLFLLLKDQTSIDEQTTAHLHELNTLLLKMEI